MSRFTASLERAGYGRLMVVGQIHLAVDAGRMLVILGSNGAGKTTTLRALMGQVQTAGRNITLNGEDLTALPTYLLAQRGVALVPDGARCFPSLSVLDNLRGAREAARVVREIPDEDELLEVAFSYFPFLRQRCASIAGTLSGGQRQMLAVARALMMRPETLLLDEPSAGLAPKVVEELFEALAEIKSRSGCPIIMAEQNVGYAGHIADDCIVLEEGQAVISGPAQDVMRHEKLRSAYLGL
jgi:branched-chain amino acid transport system ATP-binding protein